MIYMFLIYIYNNLKLLLLIITNKVKIYYGMYTGILFFY